MVETARSKGTIAWCISPVLSGVTTVIESWVEGFRKRGWEILGVAAGGEPAGKVDSRFADEYLELLAPGNPERLPAGRQSAEFVPLGGGSGYLVFCVSRCLPGGCHPTLPARVKLVTRSGTSRATVTPWPPRPFPNQNHRRNSAAEKRLDSKLGSPSRKMRRHSWSASRSRCLPPEPLATSRGAYGWFSSAGSMKTKRLS